MKPYTSVLFMGLLLPAFSYVYAQTEHPINFLDIGRADLNHTFTHNEKVRVRVDNINRFIYKISDEKTEEDFNTTVPSALSSIKLPSFLTSQMQLGSTPTNKEFNASQAASVRQADLQTDFENKLKDLDIANGIINQIIDKHDAVVHLSKNYEKPFSTIDSEVKGSFATFVGGLTSDPIAVLADKMQQLLFGKIEESNNIKNDMEELLKAWKIKALATFRATQVINDDQLAELNSELKAMEGKKPQNSASINAKKKEIRDLERQIKCAQEDFESAGKANEATLEKAKNLLANINNYKEEGKYFKLVDDIRKVNPSNYTYNTEVVVMKKDEYRFKISAVSDERLTCNKPSEQKIEAVLRTKGGVKLDFSTGVFVMGGNEDFLGRSYYYKSVNSDQTSITTADNSKRALLGIGALMHIYKRSPLNFKIGGAFGVSSTFNFDAVNFHLGPSFILGDKDRFCITIGLTAREVDLLDSRYVLNQAYNKEDLPEDIPTFKMFPNFGWFFSLTYNVSQFNK